MDFLTVLCQSFAVQEYIVVDKAFENMFLITSNFPSAGSFPK